MHAEILAIGDEITSGQLLDTNSQWLSLRLEELGIRVLYHATVGDELEPLAEVFKLACARSDVVIATGGLGPTADDLSRDALALAAGVPLVLDPAALEHVRQLFARRKRPMPAQNERQALFPKGSRVVPNPHGTAPGIDFDMPRPGAAPSRIFVLPGVPAEMIEMWEQTVAGALRGLGAGGRMIRHRRIKCFGAGESQIEAVLPDMIRRGRSPRVGINASQTTIILRITAEGASETECQAAMEPTVETIRKSLSTLVYGEEDEELQDVVLRLLGEKQQTMATLEWGTAGLIADWLGAAADPGPFLGGMVVASETGLLQVLDLPADLIARHGARSGEVAGAMAVACRERFAADYGLAIGPFPAFEATSPEPKPAFIALAAAGGVTLKPIPFAGHPATLKVLCAKHALNMLRLTCGGART